MNQQLPIPSTKNWQILYEPDAEARCIKDNPPMTGFGRQLKVGDIVKVNGVTWAGTKYQLAVKEECAFYDLEEYFEPLL